VKKLLHPIHVTPGGDKVAKQGTSASDIDPHKRFLRKDRQLQNMAKANSAGVNVANKIVEEYKAVFENMGVPPVPFEKLQKSAEYNGMPYMFVDLIRRIKLFKSHYNSGKVSSEAATILEQIGVEMPLKDKDEKWRENWLWWMEYAPNNIAYPSYRDVEGGIPQKLAWLSKNLRIFNLMRCGGHVMFGEPDKLTKDQYDEMLKLVKLLDAKNWPPKRQWRLDERD
jgi:hypothetical protein